MYRIRFHDRTSAKIVQITCDKIRCPSAASVKMSSILIRVSVDRNKNPLPFKRTLKEQLLRLDTSIVMQDDPNEAIYEVIDKYMDQGLLEYTGDNFLRLTETGLDVSNTVMAEFLL